MEETMKDLLKVVGEDFLNNVYDDTVYDYLQEKTDEYYIGQLKIINCISKHGEEYFTILNTNKFHVHSLNKKEVKKICECYRKIVTNKKIEGYTYTVRDKAIKLCGFKVKYR